MTLNDLLNEHACIAFDKQSAFAEFLGENYVWEIDLDKGKIAFSKTKNNKNYNFTFQILGSESDEDNTWLWSWANTESHIPSRLLAAANAMHTIGIENNISEIITAKIYLDELPNAGHIFCMIGSSEFKASAYFRANYKGGAAYVLVQGIPMEARVDSHKLVATFSKVISIFEIDHKVALEVYLSHHGYKIEKSGENKWEAAKNSQPPIRVTFDNLGRVEEISVI